MKNLKYACSLDSIFKKFGCVAILILLYCCTPKLLPPTEADATRTKSSLSSLQQAHTLYINKCGACHALKLPSSKNEYVWKKIVPDMAKRAKLSAQEEGLILHYVLAMRETKK